MEKQIANFPEYTIDEYGRVFSKRRNQYLNPIITKSGYAQVNLSVKGVRKAIHIHRLVTEAFIDNPLSLPEIDHINTIKSDNRVENLKWCTRQENENNPLTRQHLSENHPRKRGIIATAPNGTIIEYKSITEAEKTGLFDHRAISAVCSGKQKTHRGYSFRYKD